MNFEYSRKAPLLRIAFLAAALSVTLFIGGFIDMLASSHFAERGEASSVRPVTMASR
jgi:hypothetical protein